MSDTHVRVRVAGEQYALPVGSVLEVAERGKITPVPGAPPEVLGVRNFHGQVIPVIDMASRLGLDRDAEAPLIVVAQEGEHQAGLAVDEVLEVGEMPKVSNETESDLLAGAATIEGSLVGVVDVAAVLGGSEVT
jgi:purine-binding chemotaxis protein CheW